MNVDPDEVKWTSYVLDEVDLPERAELEVMLACDPQARSTVESIREAVEQLQLEIDEEPEFRLTEKQHQEILGAPELSVAETAPGGLFRSAGRGWIGAAAAILIALICLAFMVLPGWFERSHRDILAASAVRAQADEGLIISESGEESGLLANLPVNESLLEESPMIVEESTDVLPTISRAVPVVYNRPFVSVVEQPVVDCSLLIGAPSYDGIRETIWGGQIPESAKVNVAELVNYFTYNYERPAEGHPFSLFMEATTCPWNARHRLVQIGLKGMELSGGSPLPSNVILLLDGVELRQHGFDRAMLLQLIGALRQRLGPEERLTLVDGSRIDGSAIKVEASDQTAALIETLVALPPSGGVEVGLSNEWILGEIVSKLSDVNRNEVVLVSGGASGSRVRERIRLLALVQQTMPGNVGFSILRIGSALEDWNLPIPIDGQDALIPRAVTTMAQANHYWDTLLARSNPAVANDVRMQLEFNADTVLAYRRLGEGSRGMVPKQSGEQVTGGQTVTSGQELTSLFEVVPVVQLGEPRENPDLVQASELETRERNKVLTQNMLTVKLNYRLVSDDQHVREVYPFYDRGKTLKEASDNIKFSASVAAYGMVLSDAPFRGTINHYGILELAQEGLGEDSNGTRNEFLELIKRTIKLVLSRGSRVSG